MADPTLQEQLTSPATVARNSSGSPTVVAGTLLDVVNPTVGLVDKGSNLARAAFFFTIGYFIAK